MASHARWSPSWTGRVRSVNSPGPFRGGSQRDGRFRLHLFVRFWGWINRWHASYEQSDWPTNRVRCKVLSAHTPADAGASRAVEHNAWYFLRLQSRGEAGDTLTAVLSLEFPVMSEDWSGFYSKLKTQNSTLKTPRLDR